jgi:WS/DGAT/MGAT family acyltransferase
VPRYRQRLAYLPLQRHPAWVDDARFNLDYHVRHTSLPKPGGDQNLRDLVGRILSQQLDRDKPLWEMWIIEGLHGDRFAMLLKTHHCMVDGIAGQTLLSLLLEPSEETEFEPAAPWMPRPEPSALELLFCEGRRLTRAPLTALHALREALREPRQTTSRLTRDATAMLEVLNAGLRVVASTPLNRPIGTHRRIDWHSLDMRAVRAVKKRLDGTVNDVVLAVTAGAVRRYLGQRRSRIDELDYRVVIPVNMRSEPERTGRGNRISAWFLSLPIAEPDPIRRFEEIRRQTREAKRSGAARGFDLFTQLMDWTGSSLITYAGARLAASLHSFNLIVTNIPGPPFPLHLLGARMLELYPYLPLAENQGLGIALMSYLGKINWGLIGDWDLADDLPAFARAIDASFAELRAAAEMRRL